MNECFNFFLNDTEKLKQSASGGLSTALAEYVLSAKGIVYGIGFQDDFCGAEWYRVTDITELGILQGSKYVKATFNLHGCNVRAFSSIAKDLEDHRLVYVCALPCEIGALIAFLDKMGCDCSKLLTADLICQGPTNSSVLSDYIAYIRRNNGQKKICKFSLRYKNPDWKSIYVYAMFEDGTTFLEPLRDSYFWKICCLLPQDNCFNCKFKGDCHKSDITLGDHWGLTYDDPRYNPMGTSVAIVHTIKGKETLLNLHNGIIDIADYSQMIKSNPRYIYPVECTKEHTRMKRIYKEHGFEYAGRHCYSQKYKLQRFVYNIKSKLQ